MLECVIDNLFGQLYIVFSSNSQTKQQLLFILSSANLLQVEDFINLNKTSECIEHIIRSDKYLFFFICFNCEVLIITRVNISLNVMAVIMHRKNFNIRREVDLKRSPHPLSVAIKSIFTI